jgi:hypothetical protein
MRRGGSRRSKCHPVLASKTTDFFNSFNNARDRGIFLRARIKSVRAALSTLLTQGAWSALLTPAFVGARKKTKLEAPMTAQSSTPCTSLNAHIGEEKMSRRLHLVC